MIFYVLRQWLDTLGRLVAWPKSHPTFSEESVEGRIDAELETGKVWRVRYLATFWAARSYKPGSFKIGDYIKVVERKGLILFIEPLDQTKQ